MLALLDTAAVAAGLAGLVIERLLGLPTAALAGPGPALAEQLCLVHPALMAHVSEVTEGETRYRLSETPRLLPAASGDPEGWLTAVAPEDVRRLAYEIGMYPARRAQVKGIRVLWVLEDTEALRVVAAPQYVGHVLRAAAAVQRVFKEQVGA